MGPDRDVLIRVQRARSSLTMVGPRDVRSPGNFQVVSLPEHDANVLRDLLLAERPTTVIEIGLAYGTSALAIAEALIGVGIEEARHVIIDAYQDRFHDAGWNVIAEVGLTEMCSLIRERSHTALARLLTEGFVADAAFVDGSHIFHNVFVDLFYLRELVRPGGLLVLDDCDWPSVATAARYFELHTGWTVASTPAPTRLRAFRLPDPMPEPSFESFTPFGLESSP